MGYKDDELDLVQLFRELEPVRGTFPPVYMLGDILIGYNKLEELTILAAKDEAGEQVESYWLKFFRFVTGWLKGEPSYYNSTYKRH